MPLAEPLPRCTRAGSSRAPVALLALALASSLAAGLACGTDNVPPDTTPRISGVVPGDGAQHVSPDVALHVTFARNMDPASITESTFKLSNDSGDVSGAVAATVTAATFTPAGMLGAQTLYTATLTTGVKDAEGAALPVAYSWSFTTGNPIDVTPPQVVSHAPLAGAELVPFNTTVSATFSKALDPNTVTNTSFTLKHGSTLVSAVVSAAGTTATLAPLSPLFAETVYTATLTADIKDTVGIALDREVSWTFTTGPTPDTVQPSIVTTLPLAAAIAQPTSTGVFIVFSEPMNGTSINTTNVKLKQGASVVSGAVTLASNVAKFVPDAALAPNATFTVTVKKDVADVAGNKLLGNADVTLQFTTGPGPDATAPAFAESAPAAAETGVPQNRPLIARFTEALSPASVNSSTFAVTVGGAAVAGAYAFAGSSVAFTPGAPWTDGLEVQVALSTGLQDASGNALAAAQAFAFTAGNTTDTTAPSVTGVVPDTGAGDVSTRPLLTLTFSEAMSPVTLSPANFTLTDPAGAAVVGDLTTTLGTLTFTPRGPLAYQTLYTIALNTAVKDAAGNALAAPWASTFTTQGLPDVQVNELLAGPSQGPTGDSNGDEVTDSGDDEFVELINSTATAQDLSSWTLRTGSSAATATDKFTFPVGTTLAAGQRAVVFGGGTPAAFGSALVFKATTSLSLTNSGGTVVLQAQPGQVADTVIYTSSPGSGASWVKSPEGVKNAQLVDHTTLAGPGMLWSPGTSAAQAILRVNRSASSPKPGALDVSNTLPLAVQFNLPVLSADLNNTSFKLFASACAAPAGEVTLSSVTPGSADQVLLSPSATLANGALHCLQISSAVRSAATGGAALGADVSWEFTSGTYVPPPDVKLNEIAAKVGASTSGALNAWGDTNGDEVTSGSDDEFVEIINNTSAPVDLAGWLIKTGSTPSALTTRFTFAANAASPTTLLPAGARAVIFGKLPPAGLTFGSALVFASPLSLTDGGGTVQLVTSSAFSNAVADSVSYDPAPSTGESWVRSPEGTGAAFVSHSTLSGSAGVLWSPGVAATQTIARVNRQEGQPKVSATGVAPAQPVIVQFNTAMLASELTGAFVKLHALAPGSTDCSTAADANLVISTITAAGANTQAVITPAERLADTTLYCVRVLQGLHTAATGGAGLEAEVAYTFTTGVFVPPQNVRINEFLAHPAGFGTTYPCKNYTAATDGTEAPLADANGDGSGSGSADEFIEFINNESAEVDVANWKVTVGAAGVPSTKFTFPAGTKLPAGARAVIFGGLQPTGSFGAGTLVYFASLGLTDGGRVLRIERADTVEIDKVGYGAGETIPSQSSACESQTRSPEGTGPFVSHTSAGGAGVPGVLWSPGVAATAAIPKLNFKASVPAGGAGGVAKSGDYFVQFNMAMLPSELTNANVKLYASSCTAPANEVTAGLTVGPIPARGAGAAAYVDQAKLSIDPGTPLTASTLYCVQVAGTIHSAAAGGSALGTGASYEFTTGL